jgi:hypothetical protein
MAGRPKRCVCKCWLSEAVEAEAEGGSNSVVESQPSKLLVAGSIPVSRSNLRSASGEGCPPKLAACAGERRWAVIRRLRATVGKPADLLAGVPKADVAQSVERVLGKDEVTGSIPVISSSFCLRPLRGCD